MRLVSSAPKIVLPELVGCQTCRKLTCYAATSGKKVITCLWCNIAITLIDSFTTGFQTSRFLPD
jgi:hypothetical protein